MTLRLMGPVDLGMHLLFVYTVFGDFEALALDSQALKFIPT